MLVTLHQTPSSYGKLPFKYYFPSIITYCDFVAISVGDVTRFEFIVFAFPEVHFPLNTCIFLLVSCALQIAILKVTKYCKTFHTSIHLIVSCVRLLVWKTWLEFVHECKKYMVHMLTNLFSGLQFAIHYSSLIIGGQVHPICLFSWSG